MADPILTAAAALVAAHPGRLWPCCEWAARILDLDEGGPAWAALNIWSVREPWAGPRAIAQTSGEYCWMRGVGYDFRPGHWYICQGWRQLSGPALVGGVPTIDPVKDASKGHTWLWYATSATTGIVLDSSPNRGPRLAGVPYLGAPVDLSHAGRPWAERVAAYPAGIAVAVLP